MTPIAERAFQVSLDQLARQKNDLSTLRSQASLGVGVNALLATIFTSLFQSGFSKWFGSEEGFSELPYTLPVAFLCLTVSLVFAVLSVVVVRTYSFDLDAMHMRTLSRAGDTDEEIYWKMAEIADRSFDENEKKLSDVRLLMFISIVAGFGQVFPWLGALLHKLS
ncbi:hypothetical protein [Pseudooceanicola nitratireducens]|uniref:hypothetical protein n=1 Tax=Pseudooceanicola nitratireducens TaxID=517719 RepID=UPI001C979B67|nr:hypothetical protein [Pseudooceanicola nitratireducens]MBY6156344.1 hypothetical protein [Pseudooceanicola nitratireducens]